METGLMVLIRKAVLYQTGVKISDVHGSTNTQGCEDRNIVWTASLIMKKLLC